MKTRLVLMAGLLMAPAVVLAAGPAEPREATQQKRLTEADRKVEAGRILLKWGGYAEKVNGQDRKAWAAALWPSLASADLDNLQKASRAVTYEGMRNALLGQRPHDDQIIDRMARTKAASIDTKTLGQLAADLVFTPITPCRIVDTRVPNDRIGAGATRDLDASNPGGNFTSQGGSNTNCGIPANPAALALSVTGLGNLGTGFLRVFPHNGTNAQGSPVPLNTINTTVTNDMIVPACQGCAQELKVYSTAHTHYAAFVTGYFMAPQATALNCTTVYETPNRSIPANSNSFYYSNVTCPAGYTAVSANCWNISTNGVYSGGSGVNGGAWCQFLNLNGSAQLVRLGTECCRVPGR